MKKLGWSIYILILVFLTAPFIFASGGPPIFGYIPTMAELETELGSVNILIETEIDASSELLAIMDDETGTGALVFGTAPTIATPIMTIDEIAKSADTVALTAAECSNTLITNYGWDGADDQTFTLPSIATYAGTAAYKFKFFVAVATAGGDTYFDTADGTTQIYLDGVSVGDGERIWLDDPAIASSISCHSVSFDGSTGDWICDSINGAWADKGS